MNQSSVFMQKIHWLVISVSRLYTCHENNKLTVWPCDLENGAWVTRDRPPTGNNDSSY